MERSRVGGKREDDMRERDLHLPKLILGLCSVSEQERRRMGTHSCCTELLIPSVQEMGRYSCILHACVRYMRVHKNIYSVYLGKY